MIIDMRLRPPYKSICNMGLYTAQEHIVPVMHKNGGRLAPSAHEKSMPLLLEEMDQAGITMGVVPIRTADGVSNDDLVQLIADYPGRFVGMAGVDPTDGILKAFDTSDTYVHNGPCKGIVMELPFCKKGPLHCNDRYLWAIYEKCEAEQVPVMLQWGGMFAPDLKLYDPTELDKVAVSFPRMTIIAAHAGWPFMTEIIQVAFCRNNVYLAPDTYMTPNTPGFQDYVRAAKNMLSERICFSTAYPLATIADTKKSYLELGLSGDILENIFCNNAVRALHLEDQIR